MRVVVMVVVVVMAVMVVVTQAASRVTLGHKKLFGDKKKVISDTTRFPSSVVTFKLPVSFPPSFSSSSSSSSSSPKPSTSSSSSSYSPPLTSLSSPSSPTSFSSFSSSFPSSSSSSSSSSSKSPSSSSSSPSITSFSPIFPSLSSSSTFPPRPSLKRGCVMEGKGREVGEGEVEALGEGVCGVRKCLRKDDQLILQEERCTEIHNPNYTCLELEEPHKPFPHCCRRLSC